MPKKKKVASLAQQQVRPDQIVLQGVRTHNLKDVDITLPKHKIITVTWVSGSGKSSLAFHTLYKEGQFRYIESLSSYLRQFFNLGTRPDLDYSSGLSPAIAIEQNKRLWNSRSTVGTLTEIDDYLRLMMAKLWDVYCYACNEPLRPKTTDQIVDDMLQRFSDQKVYMIQEIWVFDDEKKLWRWVRKNRRQVDQGAGVTRFLLETHQPVAKEEDATHDTVMTPLKEPSKATDSERIEYFYLEDPQVPQDMLPVKVYGIFDRVTINLSTKRRLKDDIIKMLWRSEKFGVFVPQWAPAKKKASPSQVTKDSTSPQYRFILLHGYWGRPTKNWLPHLKQLLEDAWHEVHVPLLPKPDKVDLDEKVQYVLDHGQLDERTILVGHSLWSAIAMKVAERSPSPLAWLISVAGLADRTINDKKRAQKKYAAYVAYVQEHPQLSFDRQTIKDKVATIEIIGTPGDKVVPFEHQQTLARELDTTVRDIPAQKSHITGTQETELMQAVLSCIDTFGVWDSHQKHTDVATWSSDVIWYTDKYYCANCSIQYPEFTPKHFSANRQDGACPKCQWIGTVLQANFDKILDPYSPYLKAILPWRDSNYGQAILKKLAQKYEIQPNMLWKELPDRFRHVVIEGDEELLRVNTWWGKFVSLYYKGVEDVLTAQYNKWVLTVDFQAMLDVKACPTCHGAKLRQESLSVYITANETQHTSNTKRVVAETDSSWEGTKKATVNVVLQSSQSTSNDPRYNIYDLQTLPISRLLEVMQAFMQTTEKTTELVERIVKPLLDRASTITDLGLWYIHTARTVDSLSWGEIQRLRLAKQLGNKLTGIMYVLDEPTIGLDAGEIDKVIEAIEQLKHMGNSIVVVEHNDAFIKASDRVVEIGPWAGDFGGKVLFNGLYTDFVKADTLTASYIRGEKSVQAVFDHTPSNDILQIKKASKYNLQGVDVNIKLGSFTIITWPSGAGKTTLMYHTLFSFLNDKQKRVQSRIRLSLLREGMSRSDILQAPVMQRKKYEHLEQIALQEFYEHIAVDTISGFESIENILYVDQTSIGKTPRSCPATFIGVFDDIRKLYAGTTEAKMLAFNAGHFSFNSSKGACPECKWYGYKKVELQFLPDTYIPCSLCKWRRYKPEILDIKWHGKSISEILDMYVMDALELFEDMWFIYEKLLLMCEIGLGYLKMGQPAHTLSWGESQRLKLVKHLLKTYRWHTVYFLDEPTVWLHPSDIERLLKVLKRFLDNGDTILMIEHERNLLKFADQVIRLDGGKVVKG